MDKKPLKNMTLQELWELFPIVLEPHNTEWKEWFDQEKCILQRICPNAVITHIGSTAVPGIMAKPTVDILMEFKTRGEMAEAAAKMSEAGYLIMSESDTRISLNKGYTPSGYADKVFHFHLRIIGDNAEIKFRDYLVAHPATAKEYETLKVDLARQFKHNRDAYTEGKSNFISQVMQKCQETYEGSLNGIHGYIVYDMYFNA